METQLTRSTLRRRVELPREFTMLSRTLGKSISYRSKSEDQKAEPMRSKLNSFYAPELAGCSFLKFPHTNSPASEKPTKSHEAFVRTSWRKLRVIDWAGSSGSACSSRRPRRKVLLLGRRARNTATKTDIPAH